MTRGHTHAHIERAYAKINLLLRILAREASGYHSIETLFQRLALHDVVHVRVGSMAPSLSCAGPSMPDSGLGPVEQNLAWRAAMAYTAAAAWDTGWEIAIDKHIPVGGGLGGGSADAAAVLRALETMCPSPLGAARLLAVAGTLGADVLRLDALQDDFPVVERSPGNVAAAFAPVWDEIKRVAQPNPLAQ